MSQAQPPSDYERPPKAERDALAEIYRWADDEGITFAGYHHDEGVVEDPDGETYTVPVGLRREVSDARYN